MDIRERISKQIEELQVLEQNLQRLLAQKQSIQVELNELMNALSEISVSSDEIYKILGSAMIKANKESLTKDLNEKKKIFEMRVNSLEKQESLLQRKAEELQSEINSAIRKDLEEKNKK